MALVSLIQIKGNMSMTNMINESHETAIAFATEYIRRRKCNPELQQKSVLERMKFWQDIIANPAATYCDADIHPYVSDRYVSMAKRNLRNLIKRYPQVYKLLQEVKQCL
jgi:hypothetical protein